MGHTHKDVRSLGRRCRHSKNATDWPEPSSIWCRHITRGSESSRKSQHTHAPGPGCRVGTHTFRHSYARHLLLHGVSINFLSRWLGHRSISTRWSTSSWCRTRPDDWRRCHNNGRRTLECGLDEHPGGAQSRRNSTKRCRGRVELCPRGWRLWGRSAFPLRAFLVRNQRRLPPRQSGGESERQNRGIVFPGPGADRIGRGISGRLGHR